jgi:hypothetical protein
MTAVKAELTEQQTIVATESDYWRAAISRIADSSRAIDSALAGRMDDVRGYPKHARSLTARAMRQRILVLAAILAAAAVISVVEVPSVFRHHRLVRSVEPSPRLALGAAAAARSDAASWIRSWVSAGAIVACDPLMCGVLASHGVGSARMLQISATTQDPLNADVVVATPAIRNEYGASLARVYAPAVLASFGGAGVRVDVRVIQNSGAAGRYARQLRADVAARRLAGAALLQNPDIVATGLVAREIAAGQVDSRLLTNLATLVHWGSPVTVLGLGGQGPGSTQGMPLLSMSITPLLRRSGASPTVRRATAVMASAVARIMSFLRVQRTPLRPARVLERHDANGRIVIEIDFGAPTQFGVFSGSLAGTAPAGAPSQQKT